jgi:HEAT repeat protein
MRLRFTIRDFLWLTLVAVAVPTATPKCSADEPQPASEDVAELVRQLPTNSHALPPDEKLEIRIADLGADALPALKNELRLGISFEELNVVLKRDKSRRSAVVRVLARIPDAQSTEALVACLADPPDNYGMQVGVLMALSKRKLSTAQIQAMLGNHEPEIVLAGVDHAAGRIEEPELKTAVERIFDTNQATAQFKNEYGKSTAGPDALWNVRFAAGKALQIDMTGQMQDRVKEILTELKQEAIHPTNPEVPEFLSDGSKSENIIHSDLNKLVALQPVAQQLIEAAAANATDDFARILDMARLRLGDRKRAQAVAESLVSAESHTIRYSAAITLRLAGDRSAIPALRKALHDPYRRQSGSDVGPPQEIYPVREAAADALIDLGADPKETRAGMRD